MAKQLQSITLQSPGFFGLNTQDSPTLLPPQFAVSARNCVIDRFGRIGSRKGWSYTTTTNPDSIVSLGEFIKNDATTEVISASATAVYTGTTTLTDITPAGYTMPTDGRFDHASLNNHHYLFRKGAKPLIYDGTTCTTVEDDPDYAGTVLEGDIVVSAFGRLWVADSTSNNSTVYWSDLLTGMKWNTGSAGSIDIAKAWPNGTDSITGIAAYNNFLIIFGRSQILVYTGANDPSTMVLQDTIAGVGCQARDTIVDTGTDILFLSDSGVKTFKRVIQEKSMPLQGVTVNVRDQFLEYVDVVLSAGDPIYSVYSPENFFYLIHLTGINLTYCIDMRKPLEDGSYRITIWDQMTPQAMLRTRDRTLYFGQELGIAEYRTYLDNGSTYQMTYFTGYLDFGAPSNDKVLKSLRTIIIGGSDTTITLNWAFDYTDSYRSKVFFLPITTIAEFGIAEFNISEFNASFPIAKPKVNAGGAGQVIQLGVRAEINGSLVSIQSLTAQAIIGRTV
jgi:hypothetical protein|tara:strand:- start:117 stop:1628 length:1512 start_codon:yes stop_codon:yes gene_type:complete